MKKIILFSIILTILSKNQGIAQNRMYWIELGSAPKIVSAELDGSNVEILITKDIITPRGIALDTIAEKIYWTDNGTQKIQRANFDGSKVEDLITGLNSPYGIVLDLNTEKMYWTDYGAKKIQCSNLDGTDMEDLTITVSKPMGIYLDNIEGKLYWSDAGSDKIMCSNLDGTNVELVLSKIENYLCENPNNITLDIKNKKMYWTEKNGLWILDTLAYPYSNVINITSISNPHFIAFDITSEKIYITDSLNNKIYKANIDGTNVETLNNTIGYTINPQGIAIGNKKITGIKKLVIYNYNEILHPNPSNGNFELQILNDEFQRQNIELRIYNVLGETVYQQTLNSKQETLNTKLTKGVYFLQLQSEEGVINKKIIIQ